MRILDFLVCDDIRQEIGGKTTLVGIYNDQIGFYEQAEQSPLSLPKLGLFVRLQLEASDVSITGLELVVRQGDLEIARIHGAVPVSATQRNFSMAVIATNFAFPGVGLVQFDMLLKQDEEVVSSFPAYYELLVAKRPRPPVESVGATPSLASP